MSFPRTPSPHSPTPRRLALAAAALLLAATPVWAGPDYPGKWEVHGYKERKPATPPPATVTRPPVKYTIRIYVVPQRAATGPAARLVAHLPKDARLWVQGKPTRQRGTLRHFESPPLTRAQKYTYTARVVWYEDGEWVSQTQEVPVWAGATSCLYLAKPSGVADALAELGPEDRKAAEAQRYCAVQPENRLGAMGKPVKVRLKGHAVFLCCEACVKQARRVPGQTLARARGLRARNAPARGK
jgi:uncharacterized protein (TIGR03000 family)